jgi:hypothetical protein
MGKVHQLQYPIDHVVDNRDEGVDSPTIMPTSNTSTAMVRTLSEG